MVKGKKKIRWEVNTTERKRGKKNKEKKKKKKQKKRKKTKKPIEGKKKGRGGVKRRGRSKGWKSSTREDDSLVVQHGSVRSCAASPSLLSASMCKTSTSVCVCVYVRSVSLSLSFFLEHTKKSPREPNWVSSCGPPKDYYARRGPL